MSNNKRERPQSQTTTLPGPEVVKKILCSTQLSMKFQLLINTKIKRFLDFSLSDVVFIMLIILKCQQLLAF